MKINKFQTIKIGSLIAIVSAIPIITSSCNISFKRQQKEMHLETSDFESKNFKEIKRMIQEEFQNKMFNNYYANQVIANSYATKDVGERNFTLQDHEDAQKRIPKKYSDITKVHTKKDRDRFFLNQQYGHHGNFGANYLSDIIYGIRENKLVSKQTRLLLNKISTIYNRSIVVYPTKFIMKTGNFINGKQDTYGKYAHAEFRADLQTPMKRRYMRKFMTLTLDIPIDTSKPKDDPALEMKRLYSILGISNAKSVTKTLQMREILNETLFSNSGIVKNSKNSLINPANFASSFNTTDETDLSAGLFPIVTGTTNNYVPEWTGKVNLTTGKTQENGVDNKHVYSLAKWNYKANVDINKTFNGTDKVSLITDYIKQTYFVNSSQPIIKSLFGQNGNWDVEVVARTWAGNDGSNYFISDWIENLGHRTNYLYYFKNKTNIAETFFITERTSLEKPKEGN